MAKTVPDHLHSGRSQQLSLSAMHLLLLGQQLIDSESGQRKNQRQLIFPSVRCSRLLDAVSLRQRLFTVQVCTYAGANGVLPVLPMWAVFVLYDSGGKSIPPFWISCAAEETQTSWNFERHTTRTIFRTFVMWKSIWLYRIMNQSNVHWHNDYISRRRNWLAVLQFYASPKTCFISIPGARVLMRH